MTTINHAQLFLVTIASALVISTNARAQSSYPNLQSCGLDFWSNVKTVQEISLDIPLSKIESPNKTVIADIIHKEGLAHAFMTVQVLYARCLKNAGIDIRVAASAALEPYRRCAYQSATRAGILVQIERGSTIEKIKGSTPAGNHDVADVLYRQAQKSFLNAVVFSAESGKACIARAVQEAR